MGGLALGVWHRSHSIPSFNADSRSLVQINVTHQSQLGLTGKGYHTPHCHQTSVPQKQGLLGGE